jgi:hypothetical protein
MSAPTLAEHTPEPPARYHRRHQQTWLEGAGRALVLLRRACQLRRSGYTHKKVPRRQRARPQQVRRLPREAAKSGPGAPQVPGRVGQPFSPDPAVWLGQARDAMCCTSLPSTAERTRRCWGFSVCWHGSAANPHRLGQGRAGGPVCPGKGSSLLEAETFWCWTTPAFTRRPCWSFAGRSWLRPVVFAPLLAGLSPIEPAWGKIKSVLRHLSHGSVRCCAPTSCRQTRRSHQRTRGSSTGICGYPV